MLRENLSYILDDCECSSHFFLNVRRFDQVSYKTIHVDSAKTVHCSLWN